MTLDRRVNAYRDDLAAESLRGKVSAHRFVSGVEHTVARGVVAVRKAPAPDAEQSAELIFGDRFTVYDTANGFAWGQNAYDSYVGYVEAAALRHGAQTSTHIVSALMAPLLPGPNVRAAPVRDLLSLCAKVEVTTREGSFACVGELGWTFSAALEPLGWRAPDFVATALRMVGVPYIWGGRSPRGLDCSGLVSLVFDCAGYAVPRDTDQQETAIGAALSGDAPLLRGDLIFWKGHVAIALGDGTAVHATPPAVRIEPMDGLIARLAQTGLNVTTVRRP